VAALEITEQKKWLEKANENEWTVSELRINMRKTLAEYNEIEDDPLSPSFNLVAWSQEGVRWLKQEIRKSPVDSWSQERKSLIKKDLEPLIEFYNKL
jgi:hypothetical protein